MHSRIFMYTVCRTVFIHGVYTCHSAVMYMEIPCTCTCYSADKSVVTIHNQKYFNSC